MNRSARKKAEKAAQNDFAFEQIQFDNFVNSSSGWLKSNEISFGMLHFQLICIHIICSVATDYGSYLSLSLSLSISLSLSLSISIFSSSVLIKNCEYPIGTFPDGQNERKTKSFYKDSKNWCYCWAKITSSYKLLCESIK